MVSAWVFVRHGSTASNDPENERFRSWSDISLSEEGHVEIRKMADHLKKLPVKELHSSTIQRALQSSKHISEALSIPVQSAKGAIDWNTGFLIGQLVKPNKPIIEYFFKHKEIPVPKGESYNKFLHRWKDEVKSRLAYLDEQPEGHVGVEVTHNRCICALGHIISGGPILIDSPVEPAGAIIVYRKGDGWTMRIVNL